MSEDAGLRLTSETNDDTGERRTARLGDLLIAAGHLTPEQRDEILDHQQVDRQPFGVLAETMFGVDPRAVEQAWAEQVAQQAEWVDPDPEDAPDATLLALVSRRQAWQFAAAPLRRERTPGGGAELVFVTTTRYLARAMRFAGWRIAGQVRFVLTTPERLEDVLAAWYPSAAMDRRVVERVAAAG